MQLFTNQVFMPLTFLCSNLGYCHIWISTYSCYMTLLSNDIWPMGVKICCETINIFLYMYTSTE